MSVPAIVELDVMAILFAASLVTKYPDGTKTILSLMYGVLSLLVPVPAVIAAIKLPPVTLAAVVPS